MSNRWHHIRIRPEAPFAVEVDHVVGVFGDPDFGFPGDVGEEGLHGAAGFEGGDKDEARLAAGEEVLEFLAALAVHRAGAGDGFDGTNTVALFAAPGDKCRGECAGASAGIEQAHGSRKRPEHGSHEVSHRFRREELAEFLLAISGVCCGRDFHGVVQASGLG